MKLERGQIKDISENIECSIQQVHRILNGERSEESRSGQKVIAAVKIMKKSRAEEKKLIKKAVKEIDVQFDK